MATLTRPAEHATESVPARLTSADVWRQIEASSFAVLGYVTPSGQPRSSGVVYKAIAKRLYTAVAPESWKARHIAGALSVAVTVPVHRGGIMALAVPIPPATVSFHASAVVHPAGVMKVGSLSRQLESLLPAERRESAVVLELIPEGSFLTYGLGVSLLDMRKPALAQARVPVDTNPGRSEEPAAAAVLR